MAKRRTRTSEGQFIADNPETLNIDEAWEDVPSETSTPETAAAPEAPQDAVIETVVSNPLAPVELELKVGSQENKLPEKLSKEKIEAAVKEKLSRKTDAPGSNPFVPSTQLENEVKEIAKSKGFPLSRGTEIGARLLARSRRVDK